METKRSEALRITGLKKHFGELSVIDDVSFSLDRGDLVCILGPSGCGKTTILRIIAGLVPYDQGIIMIDDQDVAKNKDYLREVAFVFQEPRLLPWRTAQDNVRLSLELRKESLDGEDKLAVANALALVGLTEFAHAYPHELSGGMRQRISLARAIVTRPQILLMDEPLTGLDVRNREELQEEILRIWNETKVTLLVVTHDPEEAIHLADRIIVLSNRPAHIKNIIEVSIPRPRERDSAAVRALESAVRNLFGDNP